MGDRRYLQVIGVVTAVLFVWFSYRTVSFMLARGVEIGWTHVVLIVASGGSLAFLLGCAVAGILQAAFGGTRR